MALPWQWRNGKYNGAGKTLLATLLIVVGIQITMAMIPKQATYNLQCRLLKNSVVARNMTVVIAASTALIALS